MDAFERSDGVYAGLVGFLRGAEAAVLSHAELEARLAVEGRELQRQLLQDHLDLRALREVALPGVRGRDGAARASVEAGHQRGLATILGVVCVSRLAYRAKGCPNLHPADAALNLPQERHSHGLRRLAALEAARGSYAEAVQAIARATGVAVGKRQCEQLVARAAQDVESFYDSQPRPQPQPGDVLVISADGKGIVMRPDALRPATKKAAAAASNKLKTRLSKGEKRNRKRLAELVVVYDVHPVPRQPSDILPHPDDDSERAPAPLAKGKWLAASVAADAKTVIARGFDQAQRRDPTHARDWVALVDGNNHQIDRIKAEAKTTGVTVSIVVDFIHVLEYVWGAAWCFFAEADPAAEAWVRDKALAVLSGRAGIVAGSIRRKATYLDLDQHQRLKADQAATYLLRKRRYLDYPTALAHGWPIATGVIEGACRHLVRDRMDITGARWSVEGAEAVLKLRAVRTNGDWSSYWHHHLQQEHRRVHEARYLNGVTPGAA